MRSTYAFGDSDLAARRLALVAEVFDQPSRAFLIGQQQEPVIWGLRQRVYVRAGGRPAS
jgi:hypothetical protein